MTPKSTMRKTKNKSTFISSGKESNNEPINIRIPPVELRARKGLQILAILIMVMLYSDGKKSVQPKTTMKKSKKFQGLLKYVFFSSTTPYAKIFRINSAKKYIDTLNSNLSK